MVAHAPTGTVPTADTTDNDIVSDVIGNKEDVANSTVDVASLVGLARQILEGPSGAPLTLPAQPEWLDLMLRSMMARPSRHRRSV